MFNIKPNINVTNTLRPYHMFLSLLMLQLSALGLRPLSNEVWAALQECPGNEDISCLFSLCLQLFISLQPQTLTPYSFLSHFLLLPGCYQTDQLLLQLSVISCLTLLIAWPAYTQ